jgi:Arc/MetJ-type ribon-helix-helix transcriptional regulator
MRLLNVRLSDEDARLAKELRDRGISVSDVVRAAIRAEATRARAPETLDVAQLLREMQQRHPTPPDATRVVAISRDRRAVQSAVRAKLRGRR